MKRRPSIAKRSREQAQAERQKEKAERRERRKGEKLARPTSGNEEDPDLAGIEPGPQSLDANGALDDSLKDE